MKSGMRSIGDRRYTTAAASAIFAPRGSTGSVASRVMSRTRSGSARSRLFTGAPRARTRCGCALPSQARLARGRAAAAHCHHRRASRADALRLRTAITGAPRARTRCGCALPSLQTFGDQLAHVLDGQPLLGAGHLAAEVHHGQAERARGGDGPGPGGEQLLGADDVHALVRLDLHPHVAAAAAAAEPALARVRRIDHGEPGHGGRGAARRVHDAVVAAEVARVVEDDGARHRLAWLDSAALHEVVDDLRVVQHLVRAPELRELVLDRVEAVRAVRDDLLELVLVDVLDVLRRHRLVEVLLAEPPRDLAVTTFLLHHAERDARLLEDGHHRARDGLVALVVRRRAADPVEVLDLLAGRHDRHVEALRPREALARGQAPRVAGALHVLQRLWRGRGQRALRERQVPPQVDDRVDDVDEGRALLAARHARRARPQLLGLDQLAVDRPRRLAVHVALELDDDLLG